MNKQKGFSKILLVVILLVIGSGVYYFYSKSDLKIKETIIQEVVIQKPEEVVKKYYINYLSYLNQKTTNNISLDAKFVTNNIIESINELKKQYPDGIPANPIICAQDFLNDVSDLVVKEISNNENVAKLEVYIFERPIIVTLVKEDVWKIDDINCNR